MAVIGSSDRSAKSRILQPATVGSLSGAWSGSRPGIGAGDVNGDKRNDMLTPDCVDQVFDPRAAARPRILHPDDPARKVPDLNDIGKPVAVNVERQVAERIDVAAAARDGANRPLGPSWRELGFASHIS